MNTLWHAVAEDHSVASYHYGTHRAVAPAETLRRIKPLLPRAGITRLADVTGLDWIGVPVYQAIRPTSANLSVAQGKGLTRAQARVSALMESLECFHAEEIHQPTIRATVAEMRPHLSYDPHTLPRRDAEGTSVWGRATRRVWYESDTATVPRDDIPLDWVAATDLWTGGATWVPKQLCDGTLCVPQRLEAPLFFRSSNGLASGNTVVEAVIHGLCEVVERDCSWRCAQTEPDPARRVRHSTITSALARNLLQKFERAGMRTLIVDVSSSLGLPCFEVTLEHPDAPRLYGGAGCHPSRATALIRALTEAAQTRLTMIAGSRDDIYRRDYERTPPARAPLPTEAHRSFRSSPNLRSATPHTTRREIVERVRAFTGVSPVAIDLRRPSFDLPVVHVVAPGLQVLTQDG